MTKLLALIGIMILSCVLLAWCNGSTFRSYTFHKQPMSSAGLVSQTEIRNFHARSELECAFACVKDPTCKAIQLTEIEASGVICRLRNEIGKCNWGNVNDSLIPYFELNTLSTFGSFKRGTNYGPSTEPDPRSIWKADCLRKFCRNSALIGIQHSGNNLQKDVDNIYCGHYKGDLKFDLLNSVSVSIRSSAAQQCPNNMVATAVWDPVIYFRSPKTVKCTPLMNSWKVDYGKCETKRIEKGQGESICDQVDGHPTFIVGIFSPASESYAVESITCCSLSK